MPKKLWSVKHLIPVWIGSKIITYEDKSKAYLSLYVSVISLLWFDSVITGDKA